MLPDNIFGGRYIDGGDDDDDSNPMYYGSGESHGAKTYVKVLLALVIVLLILLYYYNRTTTAVVKKLTSKGWTVYYMKGCRHCDEQALILEHKFKHYTQCSGGKVLKSYTKTPPIDCSKIKAFPMWYNTVTKKQVYGVQSLKQLAAFK